MSALIARAAPVERPQELGRVNWLRGYESAVAKSKADDKPLLILFQEIPGCSTCKNYGDEVLSHPLLVEAIETQFVPLAVNNNVEGNDRKTLDSFKEPTWNNPVVRIITSDRAELTKRLANDHSVGGLASAMIAALEASRKPVPAYLQLLNEECTARKSGVERATFAMHCFWEGEAALGQLPGVVSTLAGFVRSDEVVEVEFDPRRLSYADLLKRAKELNCASRVYTRSDAQHKLAEAQVGSSAVQTDEAVRPDKEPKYHLLQTTYRHVPMTALQAARVNALLKDRKDATVLLSPRQVELGAQVERNRAAKWPVVVDRDDIIAAWREIETAANAPNTRGG